MSRSFLALCQAVASEIGVTGGTMPTAEVINLTSQEQIRLSNWVSQADLMLQNLWSDWTFLWTMDTAIALAAGTQRFATSVPAETIDQTSLYLNSGTSTTYTPAWMDWYGFYRMWVVRPPTPTNTPTNWSRDPSGQLWLSHPPVSPLSASLQYWKTPVPMVNDADTSPIPSTFDRIIIERAKILYAEREDAAEILDGSTSEYMDLLDKLQAYALPNGIAARKARNDHTTLPVAYVI
jgi:hypothetical protein